MNHRDELAWRAGIEAPQSPSSWTQPSRCARKRITLLARVLALFH